MTLPLQDSYKLCSLADAWILQFHSVWMLGTWEFQKWQLKNNNLEVNLVNRDHKKWRTAIDSCLIMLILFVTKVSFACGFIGNDLNCVCLCFVCRLQNRKFSWTKFWKIIWNVAGCIKPIRLRYIEKLLDGKTVTASGWGRTCDG